MSQTSIAPVLYMKNVADAIAFYIQAFKAKEIERWSNDDDSVHVVEMQLDNATFHIHEETLHDKMLAPENFDGRSITLGVFVNDPDALMNSAIAAGAKEFSPMQDYEYGYRQGDIIDPFGYRWCFQKKI